MSKLLGARVALAALALAFILLPGELWGRPQSDYTQTGFDPQLVYAQSQGHELFDPLLITRADGRAPCPCLPGSRVSIEGQGFAETSAIAPAAAYELNGVRVLIDGKPALLRAVGPTWIDFVLPSGASSPVSGLSVLRNGRTIVSDTIAVGSNAASDEGRVVVTSGSIRLSAEPGGQPSVHLLTSPLSFRATFRATVESSSGGASPLRISLWNPRSFSSFDLVFGSNGIIETEFLEARGRVAERTVIGPYQPNTAYDVTVEWQRQQSATLTVAGADIHRSVSLTIAAAPALLEAYRPSLSAFASAHAGRSAAVLSGYRLALPPERFTTIRTGSPWVAPLSLALTLAGVLLLLIAVAASGRGLAYLQAVAGTPARLARSARRLHPAALIGLPLLAVAYLAANLLLSLLGGHPFDLGSETVWSYIAPKFGITNLYYVSQTATLAGVWNGVPYHEAVFPYNAAMSYYFWLAGVMHLHLFGQTAPGSLSMQMTVKAFNLAFMLADAGLAFALVRRLNPAARVLPWAVAALLLLNPAFVFDTSVWGETESVVLFPLLASLLAAFHDRPGIAWPLLALAFLSKQTVLAPVLIITVYYLVRFPARRNLEGFSAAMVLVCLVTLPFTLHGYPPSIAIDPTLAALYVHTGSGAEAVFRVVSFDGFNVWNLAAFLEHGATGIARFQYPDGASALPGVPYHALANALVGISVCALVAFVVARRRSLSARPEALLIILAAASLLQMFFSTGSLSRYFLFPVVFGAIALSGRSRTLMLTAVLGLTVTTFVAEYGSLALVLRDFPAGAPRLAPAANLLSRAMADLYLSNWFMTLASVVNGAAALLLLAAAVMEARTAKTPLAAEAGANTKFPRDWRAGAVTPAIVRTSEMSDSELPA